MSAAGGNWLYKRTKNEQFSRNGCHHGAGTGPCTTHSGESPHPGCTGVRGDHGGTGRGTGSTRTF